ncbi:hypothetical protein SRHO_G00039690 [Serrasalmus rhombeus]
MQPGHIISDVTWGHGVFWVFQTSYTLTQATQLGLIRPQLVSRVFGAFKNTNNRETVYAWFTFSHWLIYANSAANPIIYNFLSGKFREEFKAAFTCHCSGGGEKKERVRAKMSTDSHKSLSTQVSHFDNVSRISDQVV